MRVFGVLAGLAFGLGAAGAQASDAVRGEEVFLSECAACHSLEEGRHRSGPSLHGIWGAPIGAADGFRYSRAFREKHQTGAVWDEAAMDLFVERPRRFIKKNRMAYRGVRDEQARSDLLEYLKAQSE